MHCAIRRGDINLRLIFFAPAKDNTDFAGIIFLRLYLRSQQHARKKLAHLKERAFRFNIQGIIFIHPVMRARSGP
jgi:hypothetical protein